METSTEPNSNAQAASNQASLLSTYLSQFEAEQLALREKLLEFESIVSENEVCIMMLKSEVDLERSRRQDAESSVQKLKQFVKEQHGIITQLLNEISSNSVSKTTPTIIAEVGDAVILNRIFKTVELKFDELAMERFQIQLEIEKITDQVFTALKTVYQLEKKSDKFSSKNEAHSDSGNQSAIESSMPTNNPTDASDTFRRPKRTIVKPSRLVDELAKQFEPEDTVGKSNQVEQKKKRKIVRHGHDKNKCDQNDFHCLCTRSFESLGKLRRHIKHCNTWRLRKMTQVQNNSAKTNKREAKAASKSSSQLQSSILSVSAEGSMFACKYCRRRFAGFHLLRMHLAYSHGVKLKITRQFNCQTCGKNNKTLSQLLDHRRESHSAKNHLSESNAIREESLKESKSKWLVSPKKHATNVHAFARTEPDKHQCTCGTIVSSRQLLINHIRAKTVGKIFKCSLCPKRFTTHVQLKRHVPSKHNTLYSGGNSGCRDCGATFFEYNDLILHRKENHSLA